jgi:hypothetical protein
MYPISNDNILLIKYHYGVSSRKMLIRKTIINLTSKSIVNAELYDVRESATVFYYNKIRNVGYDRNHIITIGDTIGYRCDIRPADYPDSPGDSMCVILFDSQGNLVKNKTRASYPMTAGVISAFGKNDFLIRNNRDAFGQVKFNSENRISLFGLISFRNFPQIIVDDGLR